MTQEDAPPYINLTRAQELIPGTTEITTDNAGELVSKAGVTVRAKAECEQKFTEMLMAESSGIQRKDIVEKARVERVDGSGSSSETPNPSTPDNPTPDNPGGTTTGGDTPSGGDNNGGGGGPDDNGGYTNE